MAEEKSIKEISELLEGLKLLGVAGTKIAKDGIKFDDVAHLVALATEFGKLKSAFEDLKEIPAEAKDLKQDEVLAIVAKVFEIIEAIKAA